jgi:hypothetical protein
MCICQFVLALEIEHLQRFAAHVRTQREIANSKDRHTHQQ